MSTIVYNISMNFVRVIFGMLSPLIILPYINRIFSPNQIGEVEYINTIVLYFTLISGLGATTYGVREIGKYKDDIEKKTKVCLEISLIILMSNIVSYLILFILCHYEIITNINYTMLLLFSLNIFFTSFNFEWFYQGIEKQEYITKRSIAIKIFTMILIFIFVKNENDIYRYIYISVLSVVINGLFNMLYLKKNIALSKDILKNLKIMNHIKYMGIMFASSIAISIYSKLDILMLGDISGSYSVGIYNLSVKIISLGKVIITIIGGTLLPRLSYLYFSNKDKEYKKILNIAYNGLFFYTFFSCLAIYYNSEALISIFGGYNFKEAELTLKLQSVIVIFSGLAYFFGVIVLYSQKRDHSFLYCVILSALVNILLNKVLIPTYKENGAVVATIISEILVFLMVFILEKKKLKFIKLLNKNIIKIISSSILTIITLNILINMIKINFILKNIILVTIYFGTLFFLKEDILKEILFFLRKKIMLNNKKR